MYFGRKYEETGENQVYIFVDKAHFPSLVGKDKIHCQDEKERCSGLQKNWKENNAETSSYKKK